MGNDTTRKQTDTKDTEIRYLQDIYLYIPSAGSGTSYSEHTDCWGAPPTDQLLSPQAWSKLLQEMSHQWKVKADWLALWWNDSCPISVKGLLDALLQRGTQRFLKQLLVEQKGGWRDITVQNGNILGSELHEWTRRYTQQSVVRVEFLDLTCYLHADDGNSMEDKEAAVRAIGDIEHGGDKMFDEFKIKVKEL